MTDDLHCVVALAEGRQTGAPLAPYVVSFNTNAQSKSDPRRVTRAVDGELRDQVLRELFGGR